MKKVKDTPSFTIRWTVVALAVLSLTVMVSAASALEPKRASDIVTLHSTWDVSNCTGNRLSFVESFADGTTGDSPFRVPRGKVLVVTSTQLTVVSGPPFFSVGFKVFREGPRDENTAFLALVPTDSAGIGTRDVTLSPGFVVEPGVRLCAQNELVFLYGFLANDKTKGRWRRRPR
jgi:hypothetical protein